MQRTRFALALIVVALAAFRVRSQTPPPGAAYRFVEIQPGIYCALGTGTLNVGSNSAVIVNDEDVVIVDSHITPASAQAMLDELKRITTKPVRFLVNTHFHFDHANGNQVFAPQVEIIGHEFTREKLLGDVVHKGLFADTLAGLPAQIDQLKKRAAEAADPETKTRLEQQLRVQQAYAEQVKDVRPTPPTVTLTDRMTLFRGGREIRLLYLGHGHTGGDVVVYLPKERVLASGDLLVNGVANLVDGFVNEWPDTLEKLKRIDFVDVIPGHGEPFKGKERADWFQAYLRDLWQQAAKLHDQHVPAAEAAARIDMTPHKPHFPAISGPGVPAVAVTRIYAVIEGRAN